MTSVKNFFRGFSEGFQLFGKNVRILVNVALLSIVYVVGIGITSVFAKMFGKHFLDMKISKERKSYWSDLDLKKRSLDEYYKQF